MFLKCFIQHWFSAFLLIIVICESNLSSRFFYKNSNNRDRGKINGVEKIQ
jgi:hypothetical protein